MATIALTGIYATTKSYDPTGFYGAETSKVDISTTPLATAATFTQPGSSFSGNNVLGTVSFGSTSFTAMASRPIKVGGVVKGFYVWVDNEGVWSGNGTSLDKAYILSFDNAYFSANSQISSSSDKVDAALSSVLATQSNTQTDPEGSTVPEGPESIVPTNPEPEGSTTPEGDPEDPTTPEGPESPSANEEGTDDLFTGGFPELIITVDSDIDPHEIDVIAPDGKQVDEESYRIEELLDTVPEQTTYRITLEDSDPETKGDQLFGAIYEPYLKDRGSGDADDYQGDGTYTIISDNLELGRIEVNSLNTGKSERLACLEALLSRRDSSKFDIDEITGVRAANVYQLGNAQKAFYAFRGRKDFAVIRNVTETDILQLHGSAASYSLSNPMTIAGETGYGLRYQGELIALLQGSDAVLQGLRNNLNSNAFTYL